MTDEEKFTFDLEGYLIIKNVLSVDEVEAMNEIADRSVVVECFGWQFDFIIPQPAFGLYTATLFKKFSSHFFET